MIALRLRDVDWTAALESARREGSPLLTGLLSLSALHAPDFETARFRLSAARRAEPFHPLHEMRRALFFARIGDLATAAAILDRLKDLVPTAPLVEYLRGLLALRAGRAEQARRIATELEASHPELLCAKFLRAEAQTVLAAKPSKIEKLLMELPSGPAWDSLWADLLAKIALLHPQEGPAMARKYLEKKVSPDTAAQGLVLYAIAWALASAEELAGHLEKEAPGSRGESLVLGCLVERLERQEDTGEAVKTIAALRRLHPDRVALRRLHNTFLTRRAVALASQGSHEQALRLVEWCLREQPQDFIHHQNRAALFTLLRDAGSYHAAWADLNRHQYRLVLLGAWDPLTIGQIVKTHRLFARQVRGSTSAAERSSRGIFRYVEGDEPGESGRVAINQDEIASDPDLLRQWIHHSRAELVFRHCLLEDDPRRLLLFPGDRDDAYARAEGLATSAESLARLVAEEGADLARLLADRWRSAAARAQTSYTSTEAEDDADVEQLKRQHLEVFADFGLLCRQWWPEPGDLYVAEELLELIRAEAPFFDEGLLDRVKQQAGYETPFPLRVLASHVRRVTATEPGHPLTPELRAAAVNALVATLLIHMAHSAYGGPKGGEKDSVSRALAYVDRARECNPANADVELAAARFLVLGEFFDEACVALERFRRLVDRDDQDSLAEAGKLEDILRDRQKEGKTGARRQRDVELAAPDESHGTGIAELERDLDRSPGSWRLYEEMVRELAKAGRFDEAVQWSDRAVAHCLSRAEQMSARALAIEALGIRTLAQENPQAARLYAVGAHEPARKAIEGGLSGERPPEYSLLYLLGRCQLAAGAPDQARESFGRAAELCTRQSHRTVLRTLTEDVDNAYLAVARSAVSSTLQEGSVDQAVQEAATVFTRLKEPAAWLVDFARVFYNAALARIGGTSTPAAVPRIPIDAPWQERLASALASGSEVDRAIAIATLAAEAHPPSARQARALADRASTLKRQLVAGEALSSAGRLLGERRFDEVLALLDGLESAVSAEPRLLRLRILALLGLHRFDAADILVAQATGDGSSESSELSEFLRGYPALAFRQRIAVAHRLLREARPEEATEVLRGASPPELKDAAELAYCRAFAASLEGYRLRRQGRDAAARASFLAALEQIEPHLGQAGKNDQKHIIELYDRIENEVESHGGI